jgi:hypothetical protein
MMRDLVGCGRRSSSVREAADITATFIIAGNRPGRIGWVGSKARWVSREQATFAGTGACLGLPAVCLLTSLNSLIRRRKRNNNRQVADKLR